LVIYLIFKDGIPFPTTLPRIVQDALKQGATMVQSWRNEKLERTFKSLVEFNKYINPRPTEDDEEVMQNNNEW
jgi:hypothetical protein